MKVEVALRLKNETDNIFVDVISSCETKQDALLEAKKRFICIERNVGKKLKDVVIIKSRILE